MGLSETGITQAGLQPTLAMPKSLNTPRHEVVKNALVKQRKAKGMTQADVAQRLERPQSYIAKIEGGERRVDIVELIELAEVTGLDLHALVNALRKAAPKS